MKKIWKHGTTVLLLIIITILLVPSWRVGFQGWFQSLFMSDLVFSENTSEQVPIEVNDWKLKAMNGESKSFSHYIDRPILLSFWATWCPPCRAELGELENLKEKYGTKIHVISVSEESVETITKSGLSETYDFLYSTAQFPYFFEINTYPTLCIIDSRGNLIFKHSGAGGLNNEKNHQFIEGLIENQ